MPVLLRIIAQRLAVYLFAFLAFLGIDPDIHIPTPEEIQVTEEKQRERVAQVFDNSEDAASQKKVTQIEEEVGKIIEQISKSQESAQKAIEDAVNIPEIENTETGIAISENFIDNIIVNIVCVNRNRNIISMTTGSGVIISPSGIVLTNSHVANAFLFNDKNNGSYKDCTVRRENIPNYGFNAELVYLPDDWLSENLDFFSHDNPRGSGEDDYALIAITDSINPVLPTPSSFQFANLETNEDNIKENEDVLIAAYPGVGSGIFEVDSNSSLKKAISYIDELITFNRSTIDVISTAINDVAKRGSSGGGVFSKNNNLIGIISTTDEKNGGSYINAITTTYIIRDFKEDKGENFRNFVKYDKEYLISEFKKEEGFLKSIIADFL